MDENQSASLRLAVANDLLDRAYANELDQRQPPTKVIHEVRWLPPDPNDTSRYIAPEPD
jgi:hypothetical protein